MVFKYQLQSQTLKTTHSVASLLFHSQTAIVERVDHFLAVVYFVLVHWSARSFFTRFNEQCLLQVYWNVKTSMPFLWQFAYSYALITRNILHFLLPLGPGIGFWGPPSSVGDGESLGRERARKTTRRRFCWKSFFTVRGSETEAPLNGILPRPRGHRDAACTWARTSSRPSGDGSSPGRRWKTFPRRPS